MDEYEIALKMATVAHKGQTDKNGTAYIRHLKTVSRYCKNERAKIAALLHDIVEDSDVALDDLSRAGIKEDVVTAVDCLTKREKKRLEDYLHRIALNEIATEVKFADMRHNSEKARWPADKQDKAEENYQKYFTRAKTLCTIVNLSENTAQKFMKKATYDWFGER